MLKYILERNFKMETLKFDLNEKSTLIEKNGTAENALIPVIWTKNN